MHLIVKHRDCKSSWQVELTKKADAPKAALDVVLLWRFSVGPVKMNSRDDGPRHPELDPAGWTAVLVDGDKEEAVTIPTIPPAPPA
jgi:hypothetical protein